MEKNKTEEWFRREVTKDQREVQRHKKKVIEEIKKTSKKKQSRRKQRQKETLKYSHQISLFCRQQQLI